MPRATRIIATLDRARRRFGAEPSSPSERDPAALSDLAVSVVRSELERLMNALASLDPDQPRPDSPALLAAALASAIGRVEGCGEPVVTRSPAGLHSPEYWHIHIARADDRTRAAIARLTAGERLP